MVVCFAVNVQFKIPTNSNNEIYVHAPIQNIAKKAIKIYCKTLPI